MLHQQIWKPQSAGRLLEPHHGRIALAHGHNVVWLHLRKQFTIPPDSAHIFRRRRGPAILPSSLESLPGFRTGSGPVRINYLQQFAAFRTSEQTVNFALDRAAVDTAQRVGPDERVGHGLHRAPATRDASACEAAVMANPAPSQNSP